MQTKITKEYAGLLGAALKAETLYKRDRKYTTELEAEDPKRTLKVVMSCPTCGKDTHTCVENCRNCNTPIDWLNLCRKKR